MRLSLIPQCPSAIGQYPSLVNLNSTNSSGLIIPLLTLLVESVAYAFPIPSKKIPVAAERNQLPLGDDTVVIER